jgi:Flp pilus assembly pilin Flp
LGGELRLRFGQTLRLREQGLPNLEGGPADSKRIERIRIRARAAGHICEARGLDWSVIFVDNHGVDRLRAPRSDALRIPGNGGSDAARDLLGPKVPCDIAHVKRAGQALFPENFYTVAMSFWHDEAAFGIVEYGLILALVAMVAIGALLVLGTTISSSLGNDSATGGSVTGP